MGTSQNAETTAKINEILQNKDKVAFVVPTTDGMKFIWTDGSTVKATKKKTEGFQNSTSMFYTAIDNSRNVLFTDLKSLSIPQEKTVTLYVTVSGESRKKYDDATKKEKIRNEVKDDLTSIDVSVTYNDKDGILTLSGEDESQEKLQQKVIAMFGKKEYRIGDFTFSKDLDEKDVLLLVEK